MNNHYQTTVPTIWISNLIECALSCYDGAEVSNINGLKAFNNILERVKKDNPYFILNPRTEEILKKNLDS